MTPHYVTSFIDLYKDSIKVGMSNSNAKVDEIKYGEILLLAHYIMRVGVLLKRGELKNNFIHGLLKGRSSVELMLGSSLKYYKAKIRHTDGIGIEAGALEVKKKGFIFRIAFDASRHETQFTPKGFGILGKHVEISAVLSALLVADFLIEKYKDDNKMTERINNVIKTCSQYLELHGGDLSVEDEYDMAFRLAEY